MFTLLTVSCSASNCSVSSLMPFLCHKSLDCSGPTTSLTTGKALQNFVPLLSQEENLLGRKPQEPEKEEEDIGTDPWLLKNLTICLIPL